MIYSFSLLHDDREERKSPSSTADCLDFLVLQHTVNLFELVDLSDEVVAIAARYLGVSNMNHPSIDVKINL